MFIVVKIIGYLLTAFGSAPLWEEIIKFAFDVQKDYNYLGEITGMSNSLLVTLGFVFLAGGIVTLIFSEKMRIQAQEN